MGLAGLLFFSQLTALELVGDLGLRQRDQDDSGSGWARGRFETRGCRDLGPPPQAGEQNGEMEGWMPGVKPVIAASVKVQGQVS